MKTLEIKDYDRLKTLLQSSQTDDHNLAIAIVNNCNIDESYPILLALIPAKFDEFYSLSSRIGQSEHLIKYINENYNGKAIPLRYSLDWLISELGKWCERKEIKIGSPQQKVLHDIIVMNYEQPEGEQSQYYSFKPIAKKKYGK